MPIYQTADPKIAAAKRSLAEEVRKLHKLGMDCRAASFAFFLNSARHPAIANTAAPARRGKRVTA
jgi:hypothetical protein